MKNHHGTRLTTAYDRVQTLGTVSYRQLDHWVRRGYVRVQTPYGDGSGNPRTISTDELAVVAWMGHLVESGVEPGVAHRLARDLAVQGWATWNGMRIEAAA